MNAKMWPLLVVLALLPAPARTQESIRPLKGQGQVGAFLTPGQVDRWVFEGDKGETLIVHVATKEFDPLLGLSITRMGANNDETVVPDVDDPGTESRFMVRLPEKGQYKIRVHAYKNQGAGTTT